MFQRGYFNALSPEQIRAKVYEEGFDPIRIDDPPGYRYPAHTHPETKLLAFLHGGMAVTVAGETCQCRAGDRLLIPGSVEHAALVDPDGCVYFWSEKLV